MTGAGIGAGDERGPADEGARAQCPGIPSQARVPVLVRVGMDRRGGAGAASAIIMTSRARQLDGARAAMVLPFLAAAGGNAVFSGTADEDHRRCHWFGGLHAAGDWSGRRRTRPRGPGCCRASGAETGGGSRSGGGRTATCLSAVARSGDTRRVEQVNLPAVAWAKSSRTATLRASAAVVKEGSSGCRPSGCAVRQPRIDRKEITGLKQRVALRVARSA